MNIEKLKRAETEFMNRYPGGFSNPEMIEVAKKHQVGKMTRLTQELFAKEKFVNTEEVIENMIKIISKSSMVSMFEKPKFRDFARSLNADDQERLVKGFYEILHGDQRLGYDLILDILGAAKLAKWSLMTIIPYYYRPSEEVFIKPTTTKDVIKHLEIQDLKYQPHPTFEFYRTYRELLQSMKKHVDPSLSPDSAAFSGFLMISLKDGIN